jgi:predicted Rossmann fold nucleotide-binding protein DprA/Smf involved in DNA uptake
MTTTTDARKKRTEMLAELRKERRDFVKHAQESLKAQQTVHKALERALSGSPHTVPQLAHATGLPAHDVLCYVAAMKKYGIVAEAGTDESGDYYLYRLTKEAQA